MSQNKKEDKRKAILEAAARVFAREGFYNTKIGEVANEAGIAHGTVYLYFESKDELLVSVFRENLRDLIEYVKSEIQKEEGAENKLRKMISLQIELIETHPELTALLLVEFPQTGRFLDGSVIEEISGYLNMIVGVLKEGIAERAFDDNINVHIVATVIYTGIQGIATRWILEGRKYPLKKVANEISELFLRGIRPQ